MHALLKALEPVADALGAMIVEPDEMLPSDVPLVWEDQLVGGMRLPPLSGALGRMLASVERELGVAFDDLSREDKQRAVAMLDERGAFALRKSVENVAEALGVSRFTVYNYLARAEPEEATEPPGGSPTEPPGGSPTGSEATHPGSSGSGTEIA